MKLNLTIDLEEDKPKNNYHRKLTPCEKAQLLIDRIEDPLQDSQTEWEVIKATYKKLKALKKMNSEMKQLMAIVEDPIVKYHSMDPEDADILEADSYRKWMKDDCDPEDYSMKTHTPPIYARGKKDD